MIDRGSEPGRSLHLSVKDVASYGIMVGLGEAYVLWYAVERGISPRHLGLLTTLPPFVGALFQVLAAALLDRFPRRRPFYLTGSILQTLTWPVMASTVWMERSTAVRVLFATWFVFYASVHSTSPSWNSMMGDLIPGEIRGRYFAWRTRTLLFCQLLATILAGIGLHVFREAGHIGYGFAVLFLGAFLARLFSVSYLLRMTEPVYRPLPSDRFTLLDFLRQIHVSNFGRFVLYAASLLFGVHMAAPYFSLYVKRDLHFTDTQFMISESALVVGYVVQLFTWGPLCDRFGNKRVLSLCGLTTAVIPVLWVLSPRAEYIYGVQFIAGTVWSGLNLALTNFIFDAVSPGKRARCVALFHLFIGTGAMVAGLVGSRIVEHLPSSILGVALSYPLHAMMLLSAVLRLLAHAILFHRFREVRDVAPITFPQLLAQATHLDSLLDLTSNILSRDRIRRREGR